MSDDGWAADIPAEILAACFERGIIHWGLGFIPPVRLVCRLWNAVVENDPHVWSYLHIAPTTNRYPSLLRQIERAKSAPIHLTARPGSRWENSWNKDRLGNYDRLTNLVKDRCVSLDVGIDFLTHGSWSVYSEKVKWVTIRFVYPDWQLGEDGVGKLADKFFARTSKTHETASSVESLTTVGLSASWVERLITPLLSSSLAHLCLRQTSIPTPHDPLYGKFFPIDFLRMTPELQTLEIIEPEDTIDSTPPALPPPTILKQLRTLILKDVPPSCTLLACLQAPSLQTLIVSLPPADILDGTHYSQSTPFTRVIKRWLDDNAIPSSLRSLTLSNILEGSDIPAFILFLSKLPSLVFLSLQDAPMGEAFRLSTAWDQNLFMALASPNPTQGEQEIWLCPSLREMRFDVDEECSDVLEIVHARRKAQERVGSLLNGVDAFLPVELRHIEMAHLCTGGSAIEHQELIASVDHIFCMCMTCTFDRFALA